MSPTVSSCCFSLSLNSPLILGLNSWISLFFITVLDLGNNNIVPWLILEMVRGSISCQAFFFLVEREKEAMCCQVERGWTLECWDSPKLGWQRMGGWDFLFVVKVSHAINVGNSFLQPGFGGIFLQPTMWMGD